MSETPVLLGVEEGDGSGSPRGSGFGEYKMFRDVICAVLTFMMVACSLPATPQVSRVYGPNPAEEEARTATAVQSRDIPAPSQPAKEPAPLAPPTSIEKAKAANGSDLPPQLPPAAIGPAVAVPAKSEPIDKPVSGQAKREAATKASANSQSQAKSAKNNVKKDQKSPNVNDAVESTRDETEGDIMEEALGLLNESHRYWVNGDLENALEALDQAYALLLDANGDPSIARQKDDLRLMISKRLLAIYNSVQSNAKGIRSEVPLISNSDVEKEIRQFQTVEREFFLSSYQRSAVYRPIIVRELKKAGLPEELSWLPLVESGFKVTALSPARALGLWQFIPSTGYKYGLNRDDWVDERMDIEKSTRAAIDYLKELHTMFGDWLTVLAAYNCGEGRVMRTIARQHINYLDRFWDLYHELPYETARYVPRFLATVMIIKDPQKYGFDLGSPKSAGLEFETTEVRKSVRLQDLAQKLEVSEELINILNAELRHRITPDGPYAIRIPTEKVRLVQQIIEELPAVDRPRDSQTARRGLVKHRVQKGETLLSIARRYNSSISEIRSANNMGKSEAVHVGQQLSVPVKKSAAKRSDETKPTTRSYTVRKGDTLASIAQKNDSTVADLKKINQLKTEQLKIGQNLRLEQPAKETGKDAQKTQPAKTTDQKPQGVKTTPPAAKQAEKKPLRKYTVKKGDSLNKIARENNLSLDQLKKMNSLTGQDRIIPGQVLLIP